MPASFRYPKGVVTRPLPDWNSRNLASSIISFSQQVNAGHTSDGGIFNNLADGSLLVIWHLSIAATPQPTKTIEPAVAYGYFKRGPQPGFASQGLPIVVTQSYPGGVVWSQQDFGSGGNEQMSFPVANGQFSWPHEWPVCVLYGGWLFGMYVTSPWFDVEYSLVWERVLMI